MIQLSKVTCQIGQHIILEDIDLSVKQGEKIALIGPSGAGKSTLINILSNRAPYSGHLLIHQKSLTDYSEAALADHIGVISQSPDLIEPLSVQTNILMGQFRHWSFLRTLQQVFRRDTLNPLLESVGLSGFQRKKVQQLSGGEKQRVALLRVIHQDSTIILADEPISALDPEYSLLMLRKLLGLKKTLIVSLHQEQYAVQYFDRIIALKNGKISFDLPSNQVNDAMLRQLYER